MGIKPMAPLASQDHNNPYLDSETESKVSIMKLLKILKPLML